MDMSLEHLGSSTTEGGNRGPHCGTKSWSSRRGKKKKPNKNWGPTGQPTASHLTDHNISALFSAYLNFKIILKCM
jgi:hypothetical protein